MSATLQGTCLFSNWRRCLQTSGIYRIAAIPGRHRSTAQQEGRANARPPGLASESALRLHPCRALPSAPVNTTVRKDSALEKLVVVADREK